MSADDDTFEIDIYGDDADPEPAPEPTPMKDEQTPDTLFPDQARDPVTSDTNKPNDTQPRPLNTITPPTNGSSQPQPPQQGTKRKASDANGTPYDHGPEVTYDSNNSQQIDDRPLDPGATPALKLLDLHWWTTEED
ncbi:hypothetical protein LTR53_018829, partial [Teratosphaeriaceae sp. CCFEE 6253]